MKPQRFSIIKRIQSFKYAIAGLKTLFQEEHNARIHFSAAGFVVLLGAIFHVSAIEWMLLIFAIGLVLLTEAFNSSIENIADFISPDYHHLIKKVKDLGAASVLIAAIIAFSIGLIIFSPKFYELCIS